MTDVVLLNVYQVPARHVRSSNFHFSPAYRS